MNSLTAYLEFARSVAAAHKPERGLDLGRGYMQNRVDEAAHEAACLAAAAVILSPLAHEDPARWTRYIHNAAESIGYRPRKLKNPHVLLNEYLAREAGRGIPSGHGRRALGRLIQALEQAIEEDKRAAA